MEVVWSNLDVSGEVGRHVSGVHVAALSVVREVSVVRVAGRVHKH